MQKPPQLLPTRLEDAQAPGIRYRIDGELVPVLHTWLDGSVRVFLNTTWCSGKTHRSTSASGR